MVILLYCSQFVKRVFESHRQRMDNLTQKVKTDFLCHRFKRRLGQAYAHTCSLVPQRKARYVNEGHSGTAPSTQASTSSPGSSTSSPA